MIIILNKWDSHKRSIVSIFDNIFNINIHLLQRHCSYFIQSTLLIQGRDEFCIGIGTFIVSYNKNSTHCYFILNRYKHSFALFWKYCLVNCKKSMYLGLITFLTSNVSVSLRDTCSVSLVLPAVHFYEIISNWFQFFYFNQLFWYDIIVSMKQIQIFIF